MQAQVPWGRGSSLCAGPACTQARRGGRPAGARTSAHGGGGWSARRGSGGGRDSPGGAAQWRPTLPTSAAPGWRRGTKKKQNKLYYTLLGREKLEKLI